MLSLVLMILGGVVVLLDVLLLGVVVILLDVAVLLGVVVLLLDVAVLLGVNDRVAKLIATLQGKTLNTTSMAVLSNPVKTLKF